MYTRKMETHVLAGNAMWTLLYNQPSERAEMFLGNKTKNSTNAAATITLLEDTH